MKKPESVRPWGGFDILKKTKLFWVKKLYIKKGMRLSLQSHQHRYEVWVVIEGSIEAQIGTKIQKAKAGDVLFIPKKRKHRVKGSTDACIVEVAFGLVSEKDIVRYEDDFGRN